MAFQKNPLLARKTPTLSTLFLTVKERPGFQNYLDLSNKSYIKLITTLKNKRTQIPY